MLIHSVNNYLASHSVRLRGHNSEPKQSQSLREHTLKIINTQLNKELLDYSSERGILKEEC